MSWILLIEKIVEVARMIGVYVCAVLAAIVVIGGIAMKGDDSEKVVYPWEKEEKRAAKKAARTERKARKAEAKRWAKIEAGKGAN